MPGDTNSRIGTESSGLHLPDDALERFLLRIPKRPYCAPNKAGKIILPKEKAVEFPYLQVNTPAIVTYFVFDVDHESGAFSHEDCNLPPPTFSVVNRKNTRSHNFYELMKPYPAWSASRVSRKVFRAVAKYFKEALRSDHCITTQRQLAKNPLNEMWRVCVFGRQYSLSEMAEYISYSAMTRPRPDLQKDISLLPFKDVIVPWSRNCSLFEYGRRRGYQLLSQAGDVLELQGMLEQDLLDVNKWELRNHFKKGLDYREIKGLSRSIALWCWKHRNQIYLINQERNAGVMGFPRMRGLSYSEYKAETQRRQRAGALYTADVKKRATEKSILLAVDELRRTGKMISARDVAKIVGISESTVYRFFCRQRNHGHEYFH